VTDSFGNVGTSTAVVDTLISGPTFNLGDGKVTLSSSVSALQMGPGISASSILLQADSSGNLTILFRGDANDSISVPGALTVQPWGVSSSLKSILFSDGTSMQLGQPSAGQGTPLVFTWVGNTNGFQLGNPGNTDYGSNIYEVSTSGLIGLGTQSNAVGTNTIEYAEGSGGLSVWPGAGTAALDFGSGITESDVLLQANGSDLIVNFRNNQNDSITVHGDLGVNSGVVTSAINELEFSDGTVVNLGGSTPITFTWLGNSNGFNLGNTNYGSNLFEVSASGNLGFGNYSNGTADANTIEYAEGSGSLSVWPGSGTGILDFGSGITESDVLLQANGSDLIIKFRANLNDSITVHGDLSVNSGVIASAINEFEFSDGTVVNLGGGAPITFTWVGNTNGFSLGNPNNTNYGPNIYEVSASGLIGFGNQSNSTAGNNTIDYAEGSGSLSVWPGSGTGVIDFGAGITENDVLLQANGNDLIINFRANPTDSITVHGDLGTNSGAITSAISDLKFSDGAVLGLGGSTPITFTWVGGANGFSMGNPDNTNYGSNIYEVRASGLIGLGSQSNSAAGTNTIEYAAGSGSLVVWPGSGTAVLDFGAGITENEVSTTVNGSDLTININDGSSDSILVHGDLTDNAITGLGFSDGATAALGGQGQTIQYTWTGTANSNMSGANSGENVFEFGAGSESATGGGGTGSNYYRVSSGTGQAVVNANGSYNELDFEGGISDQQLWFAQSGNDLQIDLVGTSTDVTIKNWFAASSSLMQEITAGGLKIDSEVSQLVQAMATYSASTPGFDPTSSSVQTLPNDTSLRNAVAAAWHS